MPIQQKNIEEAIKWQNQLCSMVRNVNGNIDFETFISCTHEFGIYSEKLKGTLVTIGYNGGYINLRDGLNYKTGNAPMDFRSTIQKYIFDNNKHVLRITGIHPSFKEYTVELGV